MSDALQWRLAAINQSLLELPIHAARWQSYDELERGDVWWEWASVRELVNHFQWRWAEFSNGDAEPEWWIMLQLQIEEAMPMLEYMELPTPNMRTPTRWGPRR